MMRQLDDWNKLELEMGKGGRGWVREGEDVACNFFYMYLQIIIMMSL